MSDELAQDDDGTFDLTNVDIGAPDDSDDDDEEANIGAKSSTQQPAEARRDGPQGGAQPSRSQAPASAPPPAHIPRDSLDGETIFAVGEEDRDKLSDDEGSGEESGLVRSRK